MSSIKQYISELKQFCYGEQMVPLMTILCTHDLKYALHVDYKFDHTMKVGILNTAYNVCLLRPITHIVNMELSNAMDEAQKENGIITNKDTDAYIDNLPAFIADQNLIPLLTITGNSKGDCRIFDDRKLNHAARLQTIYNGLIALSTGIRKEMNDMSKAKRIDPNKGQIFKA